MIMLQNWPVVSGLDGGGAAVQGLGGLENRTEGRCELFAGLKPIVGILGQRPVEHAFQLERKFGVDVPQEFRLAIHDSLGYEGSLERMRTGQEFEGYDRGREQV